MMSCKGMVLIITEEIGKKNVSTKYQNIKTLSEIFINSLKTKLEREKSAIVESSARILSKISLLLVVR